MISTSIVKQLARYAAALATCVVLIGLHWPAGSAAQQNSESAFPDLAVSGTTPNDDSDAAIGAPVRNRDLALTSRLPWRAPIGHRQPRRADIELNESISAWERQQDRLNKKVDRKLLICRGC
jgi:hypothetical protein